MSLRKGERGPFARIRRANPQSAQPQRSSKRRDKGAHIDRSRFALAVCFLALVSCGKPNQDARLPDGTIVLQFWNGFTGPDGKTMEQIVHRFNVEHRGQMQVKMQLIEWGTYYDKLTLGLAFGGAPDVFILHANRVPEYADHGALSSIDDLMKGVDASDFVPRAWQAGLWKGHRYALPLDCHPMGMYYNVDLFRKAGIGHPPTNLREFVDDARKMTIDKDGDGKPDQWGFAYTDLHLTSTTLFDQFGGGVLRPDLEQSALDSPQSLRAIDLMQALYRDYRICPTPEGNDGWAGFRIGKVAMAFQGIWMINELNNQKGLNYAAAPVPIFGPIKADWAGSHCMLMPASLKGDRRQAAWEFIRYLSDNSLDWAKGGQVPVRKHILASQEFQSLKVQPQFAKQLPYATYEPFSVSINQVAGMADSAVEAVLNGGEDPKQALKTAARRVNSVLERE